MVKRENKCTCKAAATSERWPFPLVLPELAIWKMCANQKAGADASLVEMSPTYADKGFNSLCRCPRMQLVVERDGDNRRVTVGRGSFICSWKRILEGKG